MSYQRSRAIRTTSLKDLILDRTIQGRGLGTSIASSIKDKTIASVKGVTEKFDPLNIATAFGGSLGGYAFGRLTGRSREDISYFTGRSGRGSFIDSRKNKNPLVTKVASGENRPTKKGDGLADIMARIFNLVKAHSQEVKKRQELTANFEEEKEDERELRHKELIQAISNIGGGTATPVGPARQEKGIFGKLLAMMKNMIEKAMKAIKPILEFVRTMMKALGGKALKFLQFLSLLGDAGVLSVLLPAGAALALGWLINEEKRKIDENPNDPKYRNLPRALVKKGQVTSEEQAAKQNSKAAGGKQVLRGEIQGALDSGLPNETLKELYGANKDELKKWTDKTKNEPSASWQIPVKDSAGNIIIKAGDTREDLRVTPPYLQTPRQKGFQPGGSTATEMKNVDTTPTTSATNSSTRSAVTPMTGQDRGAFIPESKPVVTPAASPVVERTNPVTGRMSMAQRQNLDLNLDVASASEPIIIDKSKVIAGGDSGGIDIIKSASVRIDNPTLKGIQKQSLRSFA